MEATASSGVLITWHDISLTCYVPQMNFLYMTLLAQMLKSLPVAAAHQESKETADPTKIGAARLASWQPHSAQHGTALSIEYIHRST